jgi:hypothetical protein
MAAPTRRQPRVIKRNAQLLAATNELETRFGGAATLEHVIRELSKPSLPSLPKRRGRPTLKTDLPLLFQMTHIIVVEGAQGAAPFAAAKQVLRQAGTPEYLLEDRARVLVRKYNKHKKALQQMLEQMLQFCSVLALVHVMLKGTLNAFSPLFAAINEIRHKTALVAAGYKEAADTLNANAAAFVNTMNEIYHQIALAQNSFAKCRFKFKA